MASTAATAVVSELLVGVGLLIVVSPVRHRLCPGGFALVLITDGVNDTDGTSNAY